MPEEEVIHILAVDHQPAQLIALESILEELEVQVVRAGSGEQALALSTQQDFALILLNVSLPGLSGLGTARRLRAKPETKHVPIIFITELGSIEEQVSEAYALGAVDFLVAPLVAPVLAAKVGVFVDLHRKTAMMKRQQELLSAAREREYQHELTQQRADWEAERLRRDVEHQREVVAAARQHAVTLHSIADAVIAADAQQRVTLLNRAAENLCGYRGDEARGQLLMNVVSLLHPVTRKPRDPSEAGGDFLLVARDGTERLVTDSSAPIVDETGREVGEVLVFRDVTAQRRMEHAVRNHQRLDSLGQLAAGVAHDFNNMLGVIQVSASLAGQKVVESSSLADLLADIDTACERASELTRQLLTFAKGGAPVRRRSDVGQLVTESIRLSLRGSGTRAEFHLAQDLWLAELDTDQIAQVLSNLGLNARDAMDGNGRVVVTARNLRLDRERPPLAPGSYVEISVQDEGTGIAQQHKDLVFDPYFSTKAGHHGLGLASAYSVVRRHGGALQVESVQGQGSRFTVYLPARPGVALGEESPGSDDYAGGGHVLVMDDEPRLRKLLADCLVALRCRVACAEHGEQAIALYQKALQTDPFDVVLLDLTIQGGMGGAATLRKLKELDPEVAAIACSGYANDPIMCAHREHGFADALRKPFRFNMLARAVRRLIARKHLRDSRPQGATSG